MTDDLRARIAAALEAADYRPGMRRGDLADAVMAVVEAERPAAVVRVATEYVTTNLFGGVWDDMVTEDRDRAIREHAQDRAERPEGATLLRRTVTYGPWEPYQPEEADRD